MREVELCVPAPARKTTTDSIAVVRQALIISPRLSPSLSPRAKNALSPSLSTIQMNVERLQKMAGTVRTGGKGTMRR